MTCGGDSRVSPFVNSAPWATNALDPTTESCPISEVSHVPYQNWVMSHIRVSCCISNSVAWHVGTCIPLTSSKYTRCDRWVMSHKSVPCCISCAIASHVYTCICFMSVASSVDVITPCHNSLIFHITVWSCLSYTHQSQDDITMSSCDIRHQYVVLYLIPISMSCCEPHKVRSNV